MNTGTPGLGDPSASTFMVTVLPVPEAPAMSPVAVRLVQQQIAGILALRHLDLIAFEHGSL